MNPIIVALDVESAEEARGIVRRIGPAVSFYKVGMELYCAAGMDFVRELLDQGKEVFLDLKLYDIGETVKRAVAVAAATGAVPDVHAVGAVMRAFRRSRRFAITTARRHGAQLRPPGCRKILLQVSSCDAACGSGDGSAHGWRSVAPGSAGL
jgi:hypothetical protein